MKTRKFNLYISGLRSASAYLGTMLPKDIAGHKLFTIVEYAPAPDTMTISVVIKNEFAFKLPVLELPIIGEEIVVPTQAPRYVASQFRKQIKQFKDIVNKPTYLVLHWSDKVEADSPFLKKLGNVHPTEGWATSIDLNEECDELDFQLVNSVDGKAIDGSGMKHCIPPITQNNLAGFKLQVIGRLKAKPECGDNINVDGVNHYVGRALEDDEYICTTDSGDKVIIRLVGGELKHVGGIERDVTTRTRTIVYFDGTTKTL